MNRRHTIVPAFLCVTLTLSGISQLTGPSEVRAQVPPPPPPHGLPERPPPGPKNQPPKTVIPPITAGENIPGMVNEMYKSMLDMQQQIKLLQEQVSALQSNLQTQQANLEKLQTQFANHHHVVQLPPDPHTALRGTMFTTITCPGPGQPCSLNSQTRSGDTYGIMLWPPGVSPGANLPPPQPTNENTSGPQD